MSEHENRTRNIEEGLRFYSRQLSITPENLNFESMARDLIDAADELTALREDRDAVDELRRKTYAAFLTSEETTTKLRVELAALRKERDASNKHIELLQMAVDAAWEIDGDYDTYENFHNATDILEAYQKEEPE